MTITYEILNEETLPILEQLERLQLLRRVPGNGHSNGASEENSTILNQKKPLLKTVKSLRERQLEFQKIALVQRATKPGIKRQWAGMISPETAEKMLLHVEQMRNEWERPL